MMKQGKILTTVGDSEFAISFKLSDGTHVILTDKDKKEIASALVVEMISEKRNHIYFIEDIGLHKAKQIYDFYKKEEKTMSAEMKDQYLKAVLEFASSTDFGLETIEKHTARLVEEQK